MKKNKLILLIVAILLLIVVVWLYIGNPLKKIYSFQPGIILGLTAIISPLIFWKSEIMRIVFPLVIALILIGIYFVL